MKRSITMRDIAQEAGVAVSTVSKALRADPSISAVQCQRIKATAERLQYRPDPMVAKLMSHLHHHRRRADPVSIAWIDFWPEHPSGHYASDLAAMFAGAQQRAQELGYGLQLFKAGAQAIRPQRLNKVLAARNQWGIIVPPVPDPAMRMDWDLRGFAAVTIGTSLQQPVMHRVAANLFQGAMLAFTQLQKTGHKRIGLALSGSLNERTENKWLGAFLAASQFLPKPQRIPPLISKEPKKVGAWLKSARPDIVLIAEDWMATAMGTTPFAWLVPHPGRRESAIGYRPADQGRVALELVVSQIHRNERGSPSQPQTVLLDPVWNA